MIKILGTINTLLILLKCIILINLLTLLEIALVFFQFNYLICRVRKRYIIFYKKLKKKYLKLNNKKCLNKEILKNYNKMFQVLKNKYIYTNIFFNFYSIEKFFIYIYFIRN